MRMLCHAGSLAVCLRGFAQDLHSMTLSRRSVNGDPGGTLHQAWHGIVTPLHLDSLNHRLHTHEPLPPNMRQRLGCEPISLIVTT